MTSNDSTINAETKNNEVNKMKNYLLFYCKGHIQMTSNGSTINVKTKTLERITKLHSIHLEFTLQYIKLTNYYTVKNTHSDDEK